MSLYTTPLQFGYFLALAMAIRFWIRSYSESRQSDFFFGFFLLLLALEIQDYTFGFAGINVLWDEYNGIYRNVRLLLWPTLFFYFKSQTNSDFRFKPKHLVHYLPWLLIFAVHLIIFLKGPDEVNNFFEKAQNSWWGKIPTAISIGFLLYYGWQIRQMLINYKKWANQQFSYVEPISFSWFRNMLYALIAGFSFQLIMFQIDNQLDLSFYQDWWWNLGIVVIIFYISVEGYAQYQPPEIKLKEIPKSVKENTDTELLEKLRKYVLENKPYLNPTLSLKDLANQLKTNTSDLSSVINNQIGKNFNDYINSMRVEEFKNRILSKEGKNYTVIANALDSGFNSKATFNRAFKKLEGATPAEWLKDKTKT